MFCWLLLWGLAACLWPTRAVEAIVIRHDVDDAQYRQAEGAYPAVFQIFPGRGGVGTLIAPQWFVTAAHVGQDIEAGQEVMLGGAEYTAAQVIVHPAWETELAEIALIQLDRPVTGVEPIPPYVGDDELGRVLTFVGQGDTGTGLTGPTTADGQLRAATNRVERVESDMLVFRFDAPEEEGVTPLEGISGPGDSGGPALLETDDGWRLAGLSVAQDSAGRERGTYGVWEFYTRVSWYAPWIEETIEQTPLVAAPVVVDEQMPLQEAPVVTEQVPWVLYLSLAAVILLGGLMVIGGMVWRKRRRP